MPHDPTKVAEVKSWLAKAAEDLRAGAADRALAPPINSDAVFHAQQAAEKSLKAFLSWHDVPLARTHDLVELGNQCAAIEPRLEPLLRRAARLTRYAWQFRYPGALAEPDNAEVDEALSLAKDVHQTILTLVPEQTHP